MNDETFNQVSDIKFIKRWIIFGDYDRSHNDTTGDWVEYADVENLLKRHLNEIKELKNEIEELNDTIVRLESVIEIENYRKQIINRLL